MSEPQKTQGIANATAKLTVTYYWFAWSMVAMRW